MQKLITARSKLSRAKARKTERRLTAEGCGKQNNVLLLGFGIALTFLQCISSMTNMKYIQDLLLQTKISSMARSLTVRGSVVDGPTEVDGQTVVPYKSIMSMDLTEQETEWAHAIKEALTSKDSELANKITDFEYAHGPTVVDGPTVAHGPTVGLTVVHCEEDWSQMSWIEEIPSHWKLVIYETCGQTISPRFSRPWKNAGSEECTGYLQTMIDRYDNLSDINIFFQSDGLLGRGRLRKKYGKQHSPFKTIQELINATMEYSPTWNGSHFLHYGPKSLQLLNVNARNRYTRYYARQVLDTMQMPYLKIHENATSDVNATSSMTRSGACFAVSPDRIRAKPVELYKQLQTSIYNAARLGPKMSRRPCCAMEQLWHAILGSPYVLPTNETVDHLWRAKMNFYRGTWGEELKRQKEQKQQSQ
ncbi:unknown protein [Seminavis robusta]|uniref:Uncharacterized protein n=1 Tax=Seminavis robusta TaxID=568900 RepID=A0A9N8EWV4_9STRA|nr:unknown protein [Seminavis robusta]|eukprot:Sro1792_g297820.1 n/a (419) ;mRNA; r:1385-2641